MSQQLRKRLLSAGLSVAVALSTLLQRAPSALAFNEQQATVAEVWRAVDRLYLDRTFNGVDWFSLRQKTLDAAARPMSEQELDKVSKQCGHFVFMH